MTEILTFNNLTALAILTILEVVLGVDNIVVLAIITSRLPKAQRPLARRIGLSLAMIQRILLLSVMSWIAHLNEPLFQIYGFPFSGRALILIGGGLFLIVKATLEIHQSMEPEPEETAANPKRKMSMASALVQIMLLDTVFSLDSVITAVGIADSLTVMVLAIVIAVLAMMAFANQVSEYILEHPTVKMLALSFLFMIGVVLLADGMGKPMEKSYIYTAMAFAGLVEGLNQARRRKHAKIQVSKDKHSH